MFCGMRSVRFMCAYIDKYSPENGGGEKGSDSIYHSYTPFEIEWLMNRNIMVKAIPLNAKPTLKLGAKNEAKVKATKERLDRSISFPAYNLRWNSFSSILNDTIIGNLFCQELCSKMRKKRGQVLILEYKEREGDSRFKT